MSTVFCDHLPGGRSAEDLQGTLKQQLRSQAVEQVGYKWPQSAQHIHQIIHKSLDYLPLTSVSAVQDGSQLLPKQITQIAHFFSQGLFAHLKLYNFLFTQPQAHDEHEASLQVSTL